MLIVAFDVDNTLHDPLGGAYAQTVAHFAASVSGEPAECAAVDGLESARRWGPALERCGLQNPLHERGCPDGLAAWCLAYCAEPTVLQALHVFADEQPRWRGLLEGLMAEVERTGEGPLAARVAAERRVRYRVLHDAAVRELVQRIGDLAVQPMLGSWAELYAKLEAGQPLPDPSELLAAAVGAAEHVVVISEGRLAIQQAKLERLSCAELFAGRLLTTETAARPAGWRELAAAIDRRVAELPHSDTPDEKLDDLLHWQVLLDEWGRKSPAFYARCLHALQASAEQPEPALSVLTSVPSAQWQPMRFVMIGDRYDKDVAPVQALLGLGGACTVRVRQGKYAHFDPEDQLPTDRRPAQTVRDWPDLTEWLHSDLPATAVPTIDRPPPLLPAGELPADVVHRGCASELPLVRRLAELATTAA